jgi:hypothetical protein
MSMMPLTFNPIIPASGAASEAEKKQMQEDNRRKTLENLVKQLPAEATAVYLMGLFKGKPGLLTLAMVCGVIVLLGLVHHHDARLVCSLGLHDRERTHPVPARGAERG